MSEFTFVDWIVAGIIFVVGLSAATVKAFFYDDPEIKRYYKVKKLKR